MTKQYRLTIDYEYETEAESEEEAIADFWNNIVYDTQTDTGTFIDEHLDVSEVKPIKFRVAKFHDTGGDVTEETWEIEASSWKEAAEMLLEDEGYMLTIQKGGVGGESKGTDKDAENA